MIVHEEHRCVSCVWFDGDEQDVAAQRATRCQKTRKIVYADDTCEQFREAGQTQSGLEHVGTIVARVMDEVERKTSEAA